MQDDLPAPSVPPAVVASPFPAIDLSAPAPLEQVSVAELAELRRRAERYRFLFKTIVTVTCILVGATLIVVLAAILGDS